MAERAFRAVVLALALLGTPASASADWYFTPFIGYDFKGTTTLFDFEYSGESRTKVTFGGSAALIVGIFGVEADYAFVPRFFQRPNPPIGRTIVESHVQTLTGNFILAAPIGLTRESLRPYVVAGAGWMKAVATDLEEVFPVNTTLTAFNVGAGAIGMLGNRTGVRFDFRRFTNLDRDVSGVSIGSQRLSFWRLTVGVTLGY